MNATQTPVLLLTGYLGSGKTTLLNKILTNRRGIKFAVVVNDIGEVNIDADLIQKGGIVGSQDDSLVALQNGCICCTLKMDLVQQLDELIKMKSFDYIVIEASGVCEPAPIAQTICSFPTLVQTAFQTGYPVLDCIVTVVDALRMRDEFGNGENLRTKKLAEEDIENLIIQQIEFCNIILLNKAAEVTPHELGRLRQIIKALQPKAQIIECNYCDIDLDTIVGTGMFDFDEVATSATWIDEIESEVEDENHREEHEHHHHEEEHHHHDDEEEHEHCHHHHHDHPEGECGDPHCHCHHHHHHGHGETEEYGIGTFVYYARRPFDISLFDDFVARRWPKNIIRAKGMCYFGNEMDTCYVFEQAGTQFTLRNAGLWYATMPKDEFEQLIEKEPQVLKDWDPEYGDRMQKLVFIGQHLDKEAITNELDFCLQL